MTMPIDLVLVRHGESEGSVAKRSSVAGDNSLFKKESCSRHNSRLRLRDRGPGAGQEGASRTTVNIELSGLRGFWTFMCRIHFPSIKTNLPHDLPPPLPFVHPT